MLKDVDVSAEVAACHNNIALILASQGKVDAAKTAYRAAIQLCEGRIAVDSANMDCRLQLSSTYGNLAMLLTSIDQRSESLKYHQLALRLQQQLAVEHPERTEFRRELAMTFNNLSFFHRESDAKRSVEMNRQAIDLLLQIASAEPDNIDCQSDLARKFTRTKDRYLPRVATTSRRKSSTVRRSNFTPHCFGTRQTFSRIVETWRLPITIWDELLPSVSNLKLPNWLSKTRETYWNPFHARLKMTWPC